MIAWIRSILANYSRNEQRDGIGSVNKEQNTSTQNKDSQPTWVYVWKMTRDTPGHAAIQVGGNKLKLKQEDEGEYISIHPYGFPSAGLTAILPLPAIYAKTLAEDMETEAAARTHILIDDFNSRPYFPSDAPALAEPDYIFKLQKLDTANMLKYIHQTRRSVEKGETGYQLFPNLNVIGFFKAVSSFVSQDPIDVELYRRRATHEKETSQVTNCTKLVSEILKRGGHPIASSKKPWEITPDGLAQKINDSPSSQPGA